MAHIVRLPKLGLSDRGEIIEWTVSPGESVSDGEQIAVLESDKSAVDITASADGVLLGTYVDVGEEIEINPGRPIAAIGEQGEELPDPTAEESEEENPPEAEEASEPSPDGTDLRVTPKARVLAEEEGVDLDAVTPTGPENSVTAGDIEQFVAESATATDSSSATAASVDTATESDVSTGTEQKVTPKARRLARERGIDLDGVTGTGPQNAITEADVRNAASAAEPKPAQRRVTDTDDSFTVASVREQSRLERTMAEQMSRSASEKPHARGERMVNVERLQQVVEELADEEPGPTLNDLLLQAVVATLQDHPRFNAVYTDGEHRLIEEVNLGYAVDTEAGLVVPVVHGADHLSFEEFVATRQSAVEAALDGTYDPQDLQNGTFTVTNVGALGMDSSFSIVNPPQVAILAVGRRRPALFEEDGEVVTARGVELSLSIDHRVLDGGDAGRFLETLATYIEEPSRLLRARG